jgi:hypothetical protein
MTARVKGNTRTAATPAAATTCPAPGRRFLHFSGIRRQDARTTATESHRAGKNDAVTASATPVPTTRTPGRSNPCRNASKTRAVIHGSAIRNTNAVIRPSDAIHIVRAESA